MNFSPIGDFVFQKWEKWVFLFSGFGIPDLQKFEKLLEFFFKRIKGPNSTIKFVLPIIWNFFLPYILNGQTPGDELGEFTCLTNGGRNIVDYIVGSPAIWQM
jgi:hypothetical protein